MWLAAPSSPKLGGTASWMAKCRASPKAISSWRFVSGHSCARWSMVTRFAGVRWQRPSAVSGAGLTVAALAVHIDEADQGAARSCGGSLPSSASAACSARLGRGSGSRKPCTPSRARFPRIFATP
jgi:hypothetical protein